ncbi:eukaryotic translation initiation factor 3 subunit H [Eurytemora carolleeae]|uniref:eukaryotic translation initiation factor 3 subunit H n=1 Tax=Eurytemora carolleeae TaxID=1294199 RepID=UPI000C76E40D|nr:eukaryotic translation initiation factor 3 subunit H [Eurytemora carolleeae]|eukprot:XP_023346196.1 eukaryotic translation initiation factor 3 subunit H-like [Eurytemora affinis]
MSDRGSRKNTENENKIEVVQIDGLVLMKLIKHCHEAENSGSAFAQGALLGLVAETRLEITHCFPFPSPSDESLDDEDFQLTMMRRLRQVNVDHQHVGWYQSAQFGNFLSTSLLESQFCYQTSIEESVCLIFDTAKTSKGFISLKAFRLTPEAIKMFKEGDFSPEYVKDLKLSYETMMVEVPIVIKNSHLMNALLLELQEQLTLDVGGAQFLDLGTSGTLETELRVMMDAVDELNQESIKFNKHQNLVLKQYQEKARWVQKKQLENQARIARGEDAAPDEDINKVFKAIPPPSRLNPLILSGTIANTSDQVSEFCSQSLAKLFITEPLQNAKLNSLN